MTFQPSGIRPTTPQLAGRTHINYWPNATMSRMQGSAFGYGFPQGFGFFPQGPGIVAQQQEITDKPWLAAIKGLLGMQPNVTTTTTVSGNPQGGVYYANNTPTFSSAYYNNGAGNSMFMYNNDASYVPYLNNQNYNTWANGQMARAQQQQSAQPQFAQQQVQLQNELTNAQSTVKLRKYEGWDITINQNGNLVATKDGTPFIANNANEILRKIEDAEKSWAAQADKSKASENPPKKPDEESTTA